MIIAIDFDGTICENEWPRIGPPIHGAQSVIYGLPFRGHDLILWTCREGPHLWDALDWISRHGLYSSFCDVNRNIETQKDKFNNDCRKIGADIYIDDKALGCPKTKDGVVDWLAIDLMIREMEHD